MGGQPAWMGRLREAIRVPDHSILLFGADPCHSPARESVRPADCPRCAALAGQPDDPVRDYECSVTPNGTMTGEPATAICLCGRSAWDGTTALAKAVKRPLAGDPVKDTDRKDASHRTAEAVKPGSTGKVRGRIVYSNTAAFADYKTRLRSKRKVPKS